MSETFDALMQKVSESAAKRSPEEKSKAANPWKSQVIPDSEELARILALPFRNWEEEGEELARELTAIYRKPNGKDESLFPIQAYTLRDLWVRPRGCVGVIPVGGGKSLISFLAPHVVEAKRPLLLNPGGLIEKTKRHLLRDTYNWHLPRWEKIRIESYETVRHRDHERLLFDYMPDLIVLDEASKLKDPGSVTTKRIMYYVKDCYRGYTKVRKGNAIEKREITIRPKILLLSGTLTVRSILDYWHLLKWIYEDEELPLPSDYAELMQWALCLDSNVPKEYRVKPGPLIKFCNDEEREIAKENPLKAVRMGYRRRLHGTPGIIAGSKPFLGCSLIVDAVRLKAPTEVEEGFKVLRKWKTPEGVFLEDAKDLSRHAVTYGLGFRYRPKPQPPKEYLRIRKEWSMACRQILSQNRSRIDSAGQLVQVMEKEGRFDEAYEKYKAWKVMEAKHPIEVETVWLSEFAVDYAADWMSKRENKRGIVWVTHKAFGQRLSEKTGYSYYGAKSLDAKGRFIEDHPHNTPMIASFKANYEGKNLQYGWSRNLFCGTLDTGEKAEQCIARTHRLHQPDDEVHFNVLWTCMEHARSFWRVQEDTEFETDMEGPRKLSYADILVPSMADVERSANDKGVLWKESDIAEGLDGKAA